MVNDIKEYFIQKSSEYERKYGYNYWDNHVKYVVDIAKNLALSNGADIEIVEIASILHDIAKVLQKDENESHNVVGSYIALELLENNNYDSYKIEKVRKCILYHSGDINNVCLSKEEWCVRNADILSMFNNITIFFFIAFNDMNLSYKKGREIIKEMIYNKYNNLDENLKKEYDNLFNSIYNSI